MSYAQTTKSYNVGETSNTPSQNDSSSQIPTDRDKLKIIAINVNSIVSHEKRRSFTPLIDQHDPDVVLIGETKLMLKHKLSFSNYNLIRTDRHNNRRGGGTAILIRKNIIYKRFSLSCGDRLNIIENTVIKINFNHSWLSNNNLPIEPNWLNPDLVWVYDLCAR